MAIRSINDKRYTLRFLLMGAAICGFSLWSLYDGFIAYPREQQRGLIYEQLLTEHRGDEWNKIAAEKGWSTEPPHESLGEEDFKAKVGMQFAMAALTAVIGLPMLILALKSYGNWVESTDTGITSSWGECFDFDQVLQVDKRKWAKKGIAKVTYQDGDRRRRFVLDDFKFERPTMDQILYELEQRIDPEKIVNGQPEPPPGEIGHEVAPDADYQNDPPQLA